MFTAVIRVVQTFLVVIFPIVLCPHVYAGESSVSHTATISATVPDQTIPDDSLTSASLIDPSANSVTRNNRSTFSWHPGTSAIGISHEQFYIDEQLIANNIYPGLINEEFYFYNIKKEGNTIYFTPKYDIADGWHTWKIVTYNTNNKSITSEIRRVYIDATTPLIILEQVEKNRMYWASHDPNSIPPESKRYLIVDTPNPLVKGKIEAYSNLRLALGDQTITVNVPTGNWEHRFRNLQVGYTYAVYLTAVDAAGNINNFPVFYITYSPTSLIGIIYPTPTIPPTSLPTITPAPPPPLPTNPPQPEVPPTTTTPFPEPTQTPIIPTPPPPLPTVITPPTDYSYLIYLIIFGLILHLTMAIIGTGTPIRLIPQFLVKLLYPFLFDKIYQTRPFTIIYFYKTDNYQRPWTITISTINGFYSLPSNKPLSLFIKSFKTGYFAPSNILPSALFPYLCISPVLTKPYNALQRLQMFLMATRSIPLTIAIITSIFHLYLSFHPLVLVYLYLSLQYTYSEYIYPQTKH